MDLKFYWSIMTATHLAYFDLVIDKFSGTDPDQDAESFIQIIERKINFPPGDEPGDAGELANYTFRKKALFSSSLRGPAVEWYENTITNATAWDNVRTNYIYSFQTDGSKYDREWKWNIVSKEMEKEIVNFFTKSREP